MAEGRGAKEEVVLRRTDGRKTPQNFENAGPKMMNAQRLPNMLRHATVCVVVFAVVATAPDAAEARDLSRQQLAAHVLNRLAYGPGPGQVSDVHESGLEAWVKQQLRPESIEDSKLEEYLDRECPSLKMDLRQFQLLKRAEKEQRRQNERDIKRELVDSVLMRAVYGKRQFQEVIVRFWRNHFNVDVNKVPFLAAHYEENVLRKHAFGKFEDLLMATAKHPAMLVYLDNYRSRADGINENYARELMELHTVGVDNGYTQDDVIAVARVLTGWTCGWHRDDSGRETYGYYFAAGRHDTDPATVMDLELDGTGGEADGERLIRYLARHPNTARFISTKLCRYLVHDDPSEDLVDRIAGVFRSSGGDLRLVYRAIIASPEFKDAANYRSKFKTPFEFLVGALRCVDARIDSTDELTETLNFMGQPIYECEDPTGYYDRAESWLDPGVMIYRWNFTLRLVRDKVEGVKIGPKFARQVFRPGRETADQVMLAVLPEAVEVGTREMVSRASDPRVMVALALGSPSFQQQ